MAQFFIQDGWALGLQHVLVTAGYILSTSKIKTDKSHWVAYDKGARHSDLSFCINPNPSPHAPTTPYRYTTICGDIMITPPVLPSDFTISDDMIESVTAADELHLQTRE